MRIPVIGSVVSLALFLAFPAVAQQVAPTAPPPGVAQPGASPPAAPPVQYVYVQAPPPREPTVRTAENGIYVEGLGPGLFYSLNYDRAFGDVAARIGISYVSLSASGGNTTASAYFLAIPVTVSYIGIGSKKHMFEIGGGVSILNVGAGVSTLGVESQSASTTILLGTAIFGYRLQPPDGGFMLRTGLSPIIGKGIFLPWPYIALGATF
jgi:hypothetical protein